MSRVKWSVEGSDDTTFEVDGHKFATNDDGAPKMCSLYCADLGRHGHIDYCRSADLAACNGAKVQHLSIRVRPNPERPKDWIPHSLHWKRMGTSLSLLSPPFPLTFLQDSKACPHGASFHTTNKIPRPILQRRSGQFC